MYFGGVAALPWDSGLRPGVYYFSRGRLVSHLISVPLDFRGQLVSRELISLAEETRLINCISLPST
jgi:hypothetical protein